MYLLQIDYYDKDDFSENYIKEFKKELIYISNKNKIRIVKDEK